MGQDAMVTNGEGESLDASLHPAPKWANELCHSLARFGIVALAKPPNAMGDDFVDANDAGAVMISKKHYLAS